MQIKYKIVASVQIKGFTDFTWERVMSLGFHSRFNSKTEIFSKDNNTIQLWSWSCYKGRFFSLSAGGDILKGIRLLYELCICVCVWLGYIYWVKWWISIKKGTWRGGDIQTARILSPRKQGISTTSPADFGTICVGQNHPTWFMRFSGTLPLNCRSSCPLLPLLSCKLLTLLI